MNNLEQNKKKNGSTLDDIIFLVTELVKAIGKLTSLLFAILRCIIIGVKNIPSMSKNKIIVVSICYLVPNLAFIGSLQKNELSISFYFAITTLVITFAILGKLNTLVPANKEVEELNSKLQEAYPDLSVLNIETKETKKDIYLTTSIHITELVKIKYKLEQLFNTNILNISATKNKSVVVLETAETLNVEQERIRALRQIIKATVEQVWSDKSTEKNTVTDVIKTDLHLQAWKDKSEQLKHLYKAVYIDLEYTKQHNIKIIAYKNELPTLVTWENTYLDKNKLILGVNYKGLVTADIKNTHHFLIAGESGSGKSVSTKGLATQYLLRIPHFGELIDFYGADFKGGMELKIFRKFGKVVTTIEDFAEMLAELKKINTKRMLLLEASDCLNVDEYNKNHSTKLSRIVVFIDEIAIITDPTGADPETKKILDKIVKDLSDLARLGRATGFKLIIATQNPNYKVLPNQIKSNCDGRMCGRFADTSASGIVLGTNDAANLPPVKGRMALKLGADTTEFQGFFYDVENLIKEIPAQEPTTTTKTTKTFVKLDKKDHTVEVHGEQDQASEDKKVVKFIMRKDKE